MSRKIPPVDERRPSMEELEPRLLFSADVVSAFVDDALVQLYTPDTRSSEPDSELEGSVAAEQLQRREIVFVDPATPEAERLLEDVRLQSEGARQIEVVLLDPTRDGIEQITEQLASRRDLDAVHLVSHGSDGRVQLGSSWLDAGSLEAYADSIAAWGDTLDAKADLLIYGCDLAASAQGAALVDSLAMLTGADVAASVDRTGSALLGGDWELEYRAGQIESELAFGARLRASFGGVLAAPVVNLPTGGLGYSAGDPAMSIDPAASVSDADSADFDGGSLTVSFVANGTSNDRLAIADIAGPGNISVSGSAVRYHFGGGGPTTIGTFSGGTDGSTPLVISLNASADLVATQALLRSITYENTSAMPSTLTRSVQFVLDDGDGEQSAPALASVDVGAANMAPSISLASPVLTYTENDPALVLDSALTISDADDTDLVGASVRFTSGFVAGEDVLQFSAVPGITASYDAATGVLTFSGTAPIADYEAALRSVSYLNSSDDPSTTQRRLEFRVDDGFDTGSDTRRINVVAVNDAPASADDYYFLEQDASLVVNAASGVLVNDSDAEGDPMTVALVGDVSNGTLTLNADGSFSYTPDPGYNGVDGFTYRANDGTLDGAVVSVGLQVNPPFGMPVVEDQGFAVDENSAVGTVVGTVLASDFEKIYWTEESGELHRSNPDGTMQETLVSGLGRPWGVAIDHGAGKIYWADESTEEIRRSNLDGSGQELLVNTGLDDPLDIELDVAAGKMYWVDRNTNEVNRANLDGSGVETLVSGLNGVSALALDLTNGKVYWSTTGSDEIQRADLDGSNVETVVSSGLSRVSGLALDGTGGKLYWLDDGADRLQRADLDGSNVETLYSSLVGARDITLDVRAGKVYWTNQLIDQIRRADMDGSGPVEGLVLGATDPRSVILGPEAAGSLTFSIVGGNPGGAFTIDPVTGEISVADPSGLDFETTPSFALDVQVQDGDGFIDTATITVDLNDVAGPLAADDPGGYVSLVSGLAPSGYWRLGEGTGGTAADQGSSGSDGTYSGVTLSSGGALAGDLDSSAYFDGSGAFVEIPHSADYLVDEGTIQLWFKPDSTGSQQVLFSKDHLNFGTGGHLTLYLNSSGQLVTRLQSTTASYYVTSAAAVTPGDWHHASFSFGSDGMRLYLDGQLVASNAYTGGLATSSGGTGNVESIVLGASTMRRIAGTSSPLEEHFAGSIDEVTFFDGQLTAAEIASLHGAGVQDYTINENDTLVVSAAEGVLINDYDAEGDPLTASLVSGPSNASAFTLNPDGSFTYTPLAGYSGTDTFTYRANDGSEDSNVATVTITILGMNDAPALLNNSLTITEGQTVTLTGADLSAADPDDLDAALVFTASNVSGGHFELSGVAATSFTQADVTAGNVSFVHDGGEFAPAYEIEVSDGSLTAGPVAAVVSFTGQNDAPVLGNNSLTVSEGQTVTLGPGDLSATDADDLDAGLVFTVSSVTGGWFELSGTPATSFSQADVTAGDVTFVHDGGEAAPAYDVAVSDGALTTGPVAATIAFTNQNDAPVLGNNSLTVTEGQTVTLGSGDLSATDSDDLDPALVFTVSNVVNGRFELSGVVVTSFSQADVTAGDVTFVHDGGEAAPSYDVEVSDGTLTTGPVAAAITFTNQNDAPVFGNNSLTVSEGQTVTLGSGDLSATDADDLDPGLVFTVSSVTGGWFELSGAAVTSFSQADVTAGNVTFVHDGGEAAPAYEVEVSDGALMTGPVAATVTFTAQNDAPVFGNNGLTVTEGQTVTLGSGDLSATDADDLDPGLVFTVSNVVNGRFELSGVVVTSFSQADVTAGDVTFVHDGGEAAPSYDVEVSDGSLTTGPVAATIAFTNQNDAPVLGNNSLTITEGQTVTLGSGDLSASDVDDLDPSLVFTVSGVSGGHFELSGAPVTSFTQADVTAGNVTFVHDGGEAAPAYDVAVSDGALTTGPVAATIAFTNQNDAPVLVNNSLTIAEGQSAVLGAADLSASDPDDLALGFSVSNVTGGRFELSGSPATSFTQADVLAGNVRFVHDGGEAAPGYDVRVSDGLLTTAPAAAAVSFTNTNDAPLLSVPAAQDTLAGSALTLSGGGRISVSDVDAGGAPIRVTLAASNGSVTLSGTGGLTFSSGDGVADATMTFTGSVSDVNRALDGLEFDPAPGFSGSADIAVAVDDLGNTGTGGSGLVNGSVSITVDPIPPLLPPPDEPLPIQGRVLGSQDEAMPAPAVEPALAAASELPDRQPDPVVRRTFEPGVEPARTEPPEIPPGPEPVEPRRGDVDFARDRMAHRQFSIAGASRLWEGFDAMREELLAADDGRQEEVDARVAAAESIAIVVSTALLGVILRGGALFAAALSALPIWRGVDPLVVLALSDEERRKREEDLARAREVEDRGSDEIGSLLDAT